MNDNSEEIGKLISEMLKEYKLEDKHLQAQIHAAWQEVGGEYLYNHTSKVKFDKACLYLYISSPAIKNELQYSKAIIITKINEVMGFEAVKSIKIF